MGVYEKRKQLSPNKRRTLLIIWNSIKNRHQDIDVRKEWDKYVAWLRRNGVPKPEPEFISFLAFEKRWLKSINVKRINNPELFKEKEREIPIEEIRKVCDILSKRRMQITEDEVRTLLNDGVSVLSVEIWFSNGIMPKNPAFRRFIASKGWR